MNFGALFDGGYWYLDPEEDWEVPWEHEGEWVQMAVQPKDLDPLETPDMNFVSTVEFKPGERPGLYTGHQSVEGWGALSNYGQAIARVLGGELRCAQLNSHDATGAVMGMEFEVRYVPERRGWQGGEPL
jgi:hypothetical protein